MMVIMKGAVVMFIDISDIKKSYGAGESRVEVLKGISFGVEKGEFCVLLGPSGSGKSTLLNIIGGIDDADSGCISINGEKIENMKEKADRLPPQAPGLHIPDVQPYPESQHKGER
jgi:ABC-type lipoprotein export system ATPase subunit